MRSDVHRRPLTLTTLALLLPLTVYALDPPAAEKLETQNDETTDRPTAAGNSAEPLHVEGDVVPPEKVYTPLPQYTDAARKARIEGHVIAQAIIDKLGNVSNVAILKGLTPELNESAAETLLQWKFKPATLDGEPVAVYYNLTVNFRLGPLEVGGDVQPPKLVYGPRPDSTKMARKAGVDGVVILWTAGQLHDVFIADPPLRSEPVDEEILEGVPSQPFREIQ